MRFPSKYFIIFVGLLSLVLAEYSLAKQKRVALIIGNSDYKSFSPLINPTNDAEDMKAKLQSFGFDVEMLLNASKRSMEEGISRFGKRLNSKNSVGLFYFAGHGVQVKGFNYLIPLGANISDEADVPYEAVDANRVLSKMELAENALNLIILDACRNNPLPGKSRSMTRGLAKMNAPKGSMVLYATSPGTAALDGLSGSRNGLFTGKLLKVMEKPGLKVYDVFQQTAQAVNQASKSVQTPYIEGVILGDFFFNTAKVEEEKKLASISKKTNDSFIAQKIESKNILDNKELAFWNSVDKTPSIDGYKAYLQVYPNGHYKVLANINLEQLSKTKIDLEDNLNSVVNQASIAERKAHDLQLKRQASEKKKLAIENKKKLEADRLAAEEKRLTIEKNKRIEAAKISLAKKRLAMKKVKLTIRSNVNKDSVKVNGKDLGSSRLELSVRPGEYKVEVSKKNHSTWNKTVKIEPGKNLKLLAKLEKINKPILSKLKIIKQESKKVSKRVTKEEISKALTIDSCLKSRQSIDKKISICIQVLKSHKNNYDVYKTLGKLLAKKNNDTQASDIYNQALKAFPNDSYFISKLKLVDSNLHEKEWLKKRNEQLATRTISPKQKSSNIQFKLNKIRCQRFKGVKALKACNKALRINANDDEIFMKKGDILFELKKVKKALVAYKNALKVNPNNVLVKNRINKLHNNK